MDNITLFKLYGKKGRLITLLLPFSLILNILALLSPFISIDQAGISTLCYTLPQSIVMMCQEKLYVVAGLILLFSILFPFVKLITLSYIWLKCKDSEKRSKLIGIIEPLGKWSMLDVFVVCIMLVLTNKQFLIGGTAEIGVIFFLFAIFSSMTASHLIAHMQLKLGLSTDIKRKFYRKINSYTPYNRKAIVISLFISLIALIAAIGFPYIKITDFLLADNSYSILKTFYSLCRHSATLSIFTFLTLVIFPVMHVITLIMFWNPKAKSPKKYLRLNGWIEVFSRLDMLDVFIFALIIFMIEGKWLIKTSHETGLILMIAFILITNFIPKAIKMLRCRPSLPHIVRRTKTVPQK